MKKLAVVALVFMLTLTTVWAQEDDVSKQRGDRIVQKREDVRKIFEEKQEGMQEKISEKRAELQETREELRANQKERQYRTTRLEENAKERVLRITERIFARFKAFVVRYEGFADRIQSRIDKLEEEGVRTDNMQNLLDEAKESLEDTIAIIAASEDEIKELIEGESSKEQIRTNIAWAKANLKLTHAAFVEAVKSLKASDKDGDQVTDELDDESTE